jgi:hypothetical protein
MLLSLGGAQSRVKGHIQGNVTVGNSKETPDKRDYTIIAAYRISGEP